jgi:hypothetical protein
MSDDESAGRTYTLLPANPITDQLHAQAVEDLASLLAAARYLVRQARCADVPPSAVLGTLAVDYIDQGEAMPRERLGTLLALAVLRLVGEPAPQDAQALVEDAAAAIAQARNVDPTDTVAMAWAALPVIAGGLAARAQHLGQAITHDWLAHCGFQPDQIAAAEVPPDHTDCDYINGWQCEDEHGVHRHPASVAADQAAELILFVLGSPRLADLAGAR